MKPRPAKSLPVAAKTVATSKWEDLADMVDAALSGTTVVKAKVVLPKKGVCTLKVKKNDYVRVVHRKTHYVGKYCSKGTWNGDSDALSASCQHSLARIGKHCVKFLDVHYEVKTVHPMKGLNSN